jgi:hypothetical protein
MSLKVNFIRGLLNSTYVSFVNDDSNPIIELEIVVKKI